MTGSGAHRDHRLRLGQLGGGRKETMGDAHAIAARARDRGAAWRVHRRSDDARRGPPGVAVHPRRPHRDSHLALAARIWRDWATGAAGQAQPHRLRPLTTSFKRIER
jgi:hypothetical protein